MLAKTRLEGLSDAVFAIVMTLLVIEIRVPEAFAHISNADLWHHLVELQPLFVGYVITFVVLAMFWQGHNFMYTHFVRVINRQLVQLNMLFLMFVALLPFSAHLLGRYGELELAVVIYGINVFLIGVMAAVVLKYALLSKEIDTTHLERRLLKQAVIRTYLTPFATLLGIIASFFSMPLALFFYAFPIAFNIVPGLLNRLERVFKFELK